MPIPPYMGYIVPSPVIPFPLKKLYPPNNLIEKLLILYFSPVSSEAMNEREGIDEYTLSNCTDAIPTLTLAIGLSFFDERK